MTDAQRAEIERELLIAAKEAGVTDIPEQAMFLAQIAHESSGFTRLNENLHYSAERLRQVFPNKFRTWADADEAASSGVDAIAERLYGHGTRAGTLLGNTLPGDGARFRGRGYIQLTGRANYAAASAALNVNLLVHPDLAEQPEIAIRIAVWLWTKDAALRRAGQQGDVKTATRRINGGLIGLEDRTKRYRGYLDLLGATPVHTAPPLP